MAKCCSTDHCNRPVKYPQMGICHACYQSLWYWYRKTPKQALKRARDLDIFTARMATILGNVKVAKRKAA